FAAQLHAADRSTHDERARSADVDHVEMLQPRGQQRWSEGSMTADVDASQKNDERHSLPAVNSRTRRRVAARARQTARRSLGGSLKHNTYPSGSSTSISA